MTLDRVRLWEMGNRGAGGDPPPSDPPPPNREPDPETAEAKATRLEAELAADKAALKQERDLRLQHETKLRETREELNARRDPPPPATGDPLDQMITDLESQRAELRENRLVDPTVDLALMTARERKQQRDQQAARDAQWKDWDRQFAAIKSDPERSPHYDRAVEVFKQGQATTPDAAVAFAKTEALNKGELENLKKEKEELERDLAAARSQKQSAGSAPVFAIDKAPPNPEGKIRVKRSDWLKLDSQPVHVQREWNAAHRSARLEIIDG